MIFIDGYKELQRRLDKPDKDSLPHIKAKLNLAYREVAKAYLWRDLERYGSIYVPGIYNTGTVAITKGRHTVSLTGGTLDSAFVNRYFKHANSNFWNKILSVNVALGTFVLESPVSETSASGLTFTIWKKFHRINPDVRLVLPDESDSTLPIPFTVHGLDESVDSNSVFVVASVDSNILVCSGATLLGNVYKGDLINLEGTYYRVKRVDSDIQITMLNYATSDFTGTAIIKSEAPLAALLETSSTEDSIKPYSYLKRVYDMVHDNDRTELNDDFDLCILDFAVAEYRHDKKVAGWEQDLLVANARLQTMKENSNYVRRSSNTFALNVPSEMPGRGNC